MMEPDVSLEDVEAAVVSMADVAPAVALEDVLPLVLFDAGVPLGAEPWPGDSPRGLVPGN